MLLVTDIQKIWLIIIFHALWDYVLLSEIIEIYPTLEMVFVGFVIVEILIAFILLRKYKNRLIVLK